jgi:competence protein ComEA
MFSLIRSPAQLGFVLAVAILIFGLGPASAGPVDINTADAATIARELKGIGLTRAQAIVAYRTQNGPFRSVDELALVKGIGPKAIQNNRDLIRTAGKVASPPSAKAPPAPRPAPAR